MSSPESNPGDSAGSASNPNKFGHSGGDLQHLTQQLIDHVDSMDQASRDITGLRQRLPGTMWSLSGNNLGGNVDTWLQSYSTLRGSLVKVIDGIQGARKKFEEAEQNNEQLAKSFETTAYSTLSGSSQS